MFWKFIGLVFRALLSLRYSVKVVGLENLGPFKRKGGILFLPNHVAHLDPLFLLILLTPTFRPRPLAVEYMYRTLDRNFLTRPLLRHVRAISVPDFESSVNQMKIRRGEMAIQQIVDGLKGRENFIVYPSGSLKRSGKEVMGGASGTHSILEKCPEANVVLIRTTGFWGSRFSRAIEGKSPDITRTAWMGFLTLLKNLIFLSPRRKIVIELEQARPDFPYLAQKLEFNRYLENWYNQYPDALGGRLKEEPLQLVSYSFWKKDLPVPFDFSKKQPLKRGNRNVSSETRHAVYAEIRRIVDNPQVEIRDEMSLATDLGLDSLNIGELMAFLSAKFNVNDLHPEDLETVASALDVAEGALVHKAPRKESPYKGWPAETNRPNPVLPLGKTIPEALLYSCERMRAFSACADDLSGIFSYNRFKQAALVLSQVFKKMKEERIAVLLPASVGSFLTIFALQLSGKTPVMLNWTLGRKYLDEMMKVSGAKKIVTSWRFLDRLSHVDLGELIDQMVYLEDIRENLTLLEKLKGAFLSLLSKKNLVRSLRLDQIDENDPAVILFTSGTESVPKGVPLSHKNLISNFRSLNQAIQFDESDIVYGILPPFHSFGFSVAGLFAFLTGTRIAFYPDPTDSVALAEGIERWKITLFCSAPAFLRGLLGAAKPEQIKSIRYFVLGAEKAPQELYEKVEHLAASAKVLEGYGITECSPVISMTRPNIPHKGVGHPIPNVEICTIHPETTELQKNGEEGELCVHGPNVFNGYLGNVRSPFIEFNGKKWYRTGDIVLIDSDGTIILKGRLKRFTKLGGEMISLGAIEEALGTALLKKGKIKSDVPSLVVCSDESVPGKTQLVLFTSADVDREEVNQILLESGFSRLIKVSSIQKIDEIPLMGAGKIDYRKIQSML